MTCREIQLALFRAFNKSGAIIAFNTTRVLAHETDVLVLRRSGITCEYEVKTSRSDFRADFRKVDKHQQMAKGYKYGPQYFYYVCQTNLIRLDEVPEYAGLIYISPVKYYGEYLITEVKKAPRLHNFQNEGIHERICRSLMYLALNRK